ncbi:MAG: ABC transporter ATP-binding protein [Thermodesulfobacteriota bacterium]|nr:ABC transporter ATP-binding protein [Thermodesulfobacteriota bacterium]
MLIRLKNISKFFGAKLVFKNVGLELDRGAILLVVGPNGAGKSTLLKIMAGLAKPTTGEVDVSLGPEKIGFLGHQTFIYPRLSAVENLRFWSGMYGLSKTENDLLEVLTRMGLKASAFEEAGSFSRGMAQRLSLARVLLLEPDLLFLDEPGTGLDVRSRGVLSREIQAAKTRGAALVWVSHDVVNDLGAADFVFSLSGGGCDYFGPAASYSVENTQGSAP